MVGNLLLTFPLQELYKIYRLIIIIFFQIAFMVKLFTITTPITIKNNPNTAGQDKVCLKNTYPKIATVNTPRPLHVA